jgi:hypothetical protein
MQTGPNSDASRGAAEVPSLGRQPQGWCNRMETNIVSNLSPQRGRQMIVIQTADGRRRASPLCRPLRGLAIFAGPVAIPGAHAPGYRLTPLRG